MYYDILSYFEPVYPNVKKIPKTAKKKNSKQEKAFICLNLVYPNSKKKCQEQENVKTKKRRKKNNNQMSKTIFF